MTPEPALTESEKTQLADTLSRHLMTEISKPEALPAHISLFRLTEEMCELQHFYEDAVAGIEYCQQMIAAKDPATHWPEQLLSYQAEADAAMGELARYVTAQVAKVDPVAGFIKYCAAMQVDLKAEEERLYRQRKTFERLEDGTKEAALLALRMLNEKRFRGKYCTIRRQANSVASVVVEDEAKIPDTYFKAVVTMPLKAWDRIRALGVDTAGVTVETHLCKEPLGNALAAGEKIEGATLVKGEHVRVS